MPKTAGAVRHKEKTPAEEHTKLTLQNFVALSVQAERVSLRLYNTVWDAGRFIHLPQIWE